MSWQQVLFTIFSTILSAFATAAAISYFTSKRNRKQKLIESALSLMAANRNYLACYLKFVEYNSDFSEQQLHLMKVSKQDDARFYGTHESAAFLSQKRAMHFENLLMRHISQITVAGGYLFSTLNKQLSKTDFVKELNAIIAYKVHEGADLETSKDAVRNSLQPPMKIIEDHCQKIIFENR